MPGGTSNDFGLDFAQAPLTVAGTPVPAGAMLVTNGENSGDEHLFAVDVPRPARSSPTNR